MGLSEILPCIAYMRINLTYRCATNGVGYKKTHFKKAFPKITHCAISNLNVNFCVKNFQLLKICVY